MDGLLQNDPKLWPFHYMVKEHVQEIKKCSSELEENLLIPENPLIADERTGISGMDHINEYLVDVAGMISH